MQSKDNWLTIHFAGGLGNQLFQLAFFNFQAEQGIKVKGEYGVLPIRKTPIGRPWIEECHSPRVSLKKTSLSRKIFFRTLISLVHRSVVFNRINVGKLGMKLVSKICTLFDTNIVTDIGFDADVSNPSTGNLFGYFQTDHWASLIDLKKYLQIPKVSQEVYEDAAITNPLVVHVRIGDYVDNPKLGVLGIDYYHAGIRESLKRYPHESIWLFSDSPETAISRIPNEFRGLVRFMDYPKDTPIQTLEKMRLGKGYVLANSSLGWWAAFLTYNPASRIFVPKPWFKVQDEPKNLIPSHWHRQTASWE